MATSRWIRRARRWVRDLVSGVAAAVRPEDREAAAQRRHRMRTERTGRRGERAACRHLRHLGYRIVARRVRTTGGEIDVVALDGETLVLVEVKTKGIESAGAGDGADATARTGHHAALGRIDARKRQRLRSAYATLARRPGLASRPVRCDAVAVVLRGRRAACRLVRGVVRLTDPRRAGGGRGPPD